MTRKHFIAIARILADGEGRTDYATRREVALGLADYFAGENPHFDRDRFLSACGIAF